jgi:excisionase family DNA binding protein
MNDDEEEPNARKAEEPELLYDLTSAKDAARLLKVSESTIWRWIEQEKIPAYRMGDKRVFLRRSELETLIKPARRTRRRTRYNVEDDRITRFRMTAASFGSGDVVSRARAIQAEILARRGGKTVSASWEDINEAREIRSDAL